MTCIHDNKVNNISEFDLLHNIINPPKLAKKLNIHYYHILHGCMNTRKGKANFKNFRILLYSVCSYTILNGRLIKILIYKKDAVMQWNMQSGNINNNIKVELNFNSPELSATNVVTWNSHVDKSAKGRYDMILGRDILTYLGLNLKLYYHIIE